MKKIFAFLFLMSILVVPVLGYAADETAKPADFPCVIKNTEAIKVYEGCGESVTDPGSIAACCLIDKILTVGNWIFTALLVIAIIVILIAAFQFVTASGDPDKVKNARNTIFFALIGVAIGFLAKIIVKVVASVIS